MNKLTKLLTFTLIFVIKNIYISAMDLSLQTSAASSNSDWRTLGYESKIAAENKVQDEVKENSESSTEKLAKINAYRSKCLEECGLYKDVNGLVQEYDPIEDRWKCETTLKVNATVRALCLLPGNKLVSGSNEKIKIWDLATSKCISELKGHTDFVCALCVLPGNKLVSGSWDKTIKIWNLETCKCERILKGHKDSIRELYLLSDNRLVSISNDCIKIWDLNSYKCIKTIKINKFFKLILLPGNKLAYSHAGKNIIEILDLTTYKFLATLEGHGDVINSLCLLSNNKLAASSYDCKIKIWDLTTFECIEHLQCVQKFYFYKLCLLADNKLLSVCSDNTIRIWDFATHNCKILEGDIIESLCLLPDNKLAFTYFNNKIKILDLTTSQCEILEGHHDNVNLLYLLPNNKLVSACSSFIKIWNNQICSINIPLDLDQNIR